MNGIDQFIQEKQLDRASYLREILMKGLSLDKQERLLEEYARGELSMMEVCKKLRRNPWEFLSTLQTNSLHLNVQLEDWLDAADLVLNYDIRARRFL